jgi:hypothetical protein
VVVTEREIRRVSVAVEGVVRLLMLLQEVQRSVELERSGFLLLR